MRFTRYLHAQYLGDPLWICSIFTMKMKMWKRTAHKINKTIRKNHKRKRRVRNLALSCIGKRNEASGYVIIYRLIQFLCSFRISFLQFSDLCFSLRIQLTCITASTTVWRHRGLRPNIITESTFASLLQSRTIRTESNQVIFPAIRN